MPREATLLSHESVMTAMCIVLLSLDSFESGARAASAALGAFSLTLLGCHSYDWSAHLIWNVAGTDPMVSPAVAPLHRWHSARLPATNEAS